jgi:hypothetical protein
MSVIEEEQVIVDLGRIPRELLAMAGTLEVSHARTLVDSYYQIQEVRKAVSNQVTASTKGVDEGPTAAIAHVAAQTARVETQIKTLLGRWAESHPAGEWALSQIGIGPVLAAGLLAHIDFERAHTAGAVWRFAGLDPTLVWNKGQKRPYNARLKVLAWKISDSMVKLSGRKELPFYAGLYVQRKRYELERDERGGNEETAAETLEVRNIRDAETRRVYESGHLPAGRLDLRARRYASKLLLAHFWQVGREAAGLEAPRPYAVEHGGHAHVIEVPPPGALWQP